MNDVFRDKVVVVNGATGGVGQAVARHMGGAGARVVVVGRDAAKLRRVFDAAAGFQAYAGDFTQETAARDTIARIGADLGGIDHVVDCSGTIGRGRAHETSGAEWHRVIDANLTAPFLLCRECYPALKQSGGSVVLFGSVLGRTGGSASSGLPYAVAKAGVVNLTRYLAKEWGREGIRVNCIAPGPVDTAMLGGLTAEQHSFTRGLMFTGRYVTPAECAAAVAYLCSPAAASVTGTTLNMSAGIYLD